MICSGDQMKRCCFTGHRPKRFPWGDNESDSRCIVLKALLKDEIRRAISLGCFSFISGGALGVDIWAAEIVLEEKESNPIVTLELAIPFREHNRAISLNDVARLERIHTQADLLTIVTHGVSHIQAFQLRDRYMVDKSDMLIAVYDDRSDIKGGTYRTLEYAKSKGLVIVQINWMD